MLFLNYIFIVLITVLLFVYEAMPMDIPPLEGQTECQSRKEERKRGRGDQKIYFLSLLNK